MGICIYGGVLRGPPPSPTYGTPPSLCGVRGGGGAAGRSTSSNNNGRARLLRLPRGTKPVPKIWNPKRGV